MDQCKNCTMRGNLKGCLETACNQHESWMALQLKAENNKLREKMRTAAWALNQTRADLEGTLWPNSGMATGE